MAEDKEQRICSIEDGVHWHLQALSAYGRSS